MERRIFKGIAIYDAAVFEALEGLFEKNRNRVLATLPWLVCEMIDKTNFKEALEFIYENGGRRIYIRHDREDFSNTFGLRLSQDLFDSILHLSDSSGYVEIPSPWGVSERIRQALIVSSFDQGMPREKIRRIYGVSSRTLTNLFRSKPAINAG